MKTNRSINTLIIVSLIVFSGLGLQSQQPAKKKALRPVYRVVRLDSVQEMPDTVKAVADTIVLLKREWDDLLAKDRAKLKAEQAEKAKLEKHGKILDEALVNLTRGTPEVEAIRAAEQPAAAPKLPDTLIIKHPERRTLFERLFRRK